MNSNCKIVKYALFVVVLFYFVLLAHYWQVLLQFDVAHFQILCFLFFQRQQFLGSKKIWSFSVFPSVFVTSVISCKIDFHRKKNFYRVYPLQW